ncbi:MAG TPA: alpha/beta hydrolase, partial [Xanthobacteraceae bacterium]|nr:alpha/beta hydrolase [Xanthobacteraceae bacterium]
MASIPYAMIALRAAGVAVVCLYVGAALLLYVTQRSLMYFPETTHTTPAQAGLAEAEEVTLTSSDGERVIAWHVAPRDGKPVVVYFHGNGGALRYRVERF